MAVLTADDQTARMLALREELLTSLRPYMAGAPGTSPMTDAAIEAFKIKTLPIIQQQMLLKGLGHSPAVSQITGETLAMALPEFLNADAANRLNATAQAAGLTGAENQVFGTQGQLALGGRDIALREALDPRRVALEEQVGRGQLGLSGVKLSADIANQEAMRQLQAYQTSGNLSLGLTDAYTKAAQIQQEQQRLALQAGQGAGALQRDIAQQVADSVQAERLRLQGLSEGATMGVFGGSVLPPSIQQTSRTKTSSSK